MRIVWFKPLVWGEECVWGEGCVSPYNSTNLNSIVYHWCSDDRVGKKWVMSNACVKSRSRLIGTNIPLFDLYKFTFNVCDKFNRSLYDTFWPHRKGGSRRYGVKGVNITSCSHVFCITLLTVLWT